MNPQPTFIHPEAAAWMQAQMAINQARSGALVQGRVERVDQWAQGIFVALRDVLFHLLADSSDLGRYLGSDWRRAAAQFDAIEAGEMPATPDANLDLLEARRLLYRTFSEIGLMPGE